MRKLLLIVILKMMFFSPALFASDLTGIYAGRDYHQIQRKVEKRALDRLLSDYAKERDKRNEVATKLILNGVKSWRAGKYPEASKTFDKALSFDWSADLPDDVEEDLSAYFESIRELYIQNRLK